MSRKRRKGPPFVMIRIDLLKDPEWRKLSYSTMLLYIYLRTKFNYKTFSEVTLAYSEMKDMMSSKTIRKAFIELMDGGWIERTKDGGLFGGVCKYKFIGPYKDFYYKGFVI